MSEMPPPGTPDPNVNPQNGTISASTPTPEYASPVVEEVADPADVEKNKVMAILAYLGILVLVPILAAKESRFAKFHANQGLILTGGAIALYFVMGVAFFIISFIPFVRAIAGCFGCIIFPVLGLGWLALAIMGILSAVNGQMKPLPFFPKITIIK